MIEQMREINRQIRSFARPVKKISLFSNGYYMLTTDDRFSACDCDNLDFVKIFSDRHVFLENASFNAVHAFQIGKTGVMMVTSTTPTANFGRELWTFGDERLFENDFFWQPEFKTDANCDKIIFQSYRDSDYFLLGNLETGQIIGEIARKELDAATETYGLRHYYGPCSKISGKINPDARKKAPTKIEKLIKRDFPMAITAGNRRYVCAVDNNLFYYFDLLESEQPKLFETTPDDNLEKYYENNYNRMSNLIKSTQRS
ncbi:MAG: hypothetical protein LBL21_03305 [Rickettsiales bacterium]|jgi:hypothetical protein|nr:hypothetical protein [Rickettsiales bacterium]